MNKLLFEFDLFSLTILDNAFSFSLVRLGLEDFNRSLLHIGKDETNWFVEILFIRLA